MFNKLFMTAHAARTASLDPLQKFRFRVTIPGLPSEIGFQTVSGLSHEVGVAEYSEGGYEYTHKLPGKPTVSEVTCERGAYQDSALACNVTTGFYFTNSLVAFEPQRRI